MLALMCTFATESLDFRSRGGRLTADIQAVIAADYIRNLREETKKGINGRLKQGLYPFRAPLGYLDMGKGRPKAPDPKKANFIKDIFDLYASGQHSFRSLRAEINRRGLRNLSNRPLSLCGIETILKNTFYCGLITIGRTGMTYQGVHEPIISAKLFRRVQDIKAGRYAQCVTRHNHLYRGLFRCGLCNAPMTPELQKGHVYYRCQTLACDTKTVREDALESCIIGALERLQITDETAAQISAQWHPEKAIAKEEADRTALRLRIADAEKRLERLTDCLIDGTIDGDAFKERQRTTKLHLAEMREQLSESSDPALLEYNRKKFLELMKNLVQLHKYADPDQKRLMIENCFSNRRVIRKYVELEPRNWLQFDNNGLGVFSGALERYRDRTFRHDDEDLTPLGKMLEMYQRVHGKQFHHKSKK